MELQPENYLVIAMFVSFIALLFTGFPVAWVLAGVGIGFAGIAYWTDSMEWTLTGLDYNTLGLLTGRIFSIMDNWVLVALPMFIFMGLMLDKSGVAERMMHSMQKLFGSVKGGLAAYNAGVGGVRIYGVPASTKLYVRAILSYEKKLDLAFTIHTLKRRYAESL